MTGIHDTPTVTMALMSWEQIGYALVVGSNHYFYLLLIISGAHWALRRGINPQLLIRASYRSSIIHEIKMKGDPNIKNLTLKNMNEQGWYMGNLKPILAGMISNNDDIQESMCQKQID